MRRALLLTGALPLLVACSPSPGDLMDAVADKPGVIEVSAAEVDVGDDDLPFATVAKKVTVSMESDVTSAEVMAVFDEYADEVEDGDVEVVELTLDGPKAVTLTFGGEGSHLSEEIVDDLVDAQRDEDVLAYERETGQWLRTLNVELAPIDFAGVVRWADRYADVDSVGVTSGDFYVGRSEYTGDDPRIGEARERLALRIDEKFDLRGAEVSSSGPLKLTVAAADLEAVRKWVAGDPLAETVGSVVVTTG